MKYKVVKGTNLFFIIFSLILPYILCNAIAIVLLLQNYDLYWNITIILFLIFINIIFLCLLIFKKARKGFIKLLIARYIIKEDKLIYCTKKQIYKFLLRDEIFKIAITKIKFYGTYGGVIWIKHIIIYKYKSGINNNEPYIIFKFTKKRIKILEEWFGKKIEGDDINYSNEILRKLT